MGGKFDIFSFSKLLQIRDLAYVLNIYLIYIFSFLGRKNGKLFVCSFLLGHFM